MNLKCVGVCSTAEVKVLDFHYFGTSLLEVLMDVPGMIQAHGNQIAIRREMTDLFSFICVCRGSITVQ